MHSKSRIYCIFAIGSFTCKVWYFISFIDVHTGRRRRLQCVQSDTKQNTNEFVWLCECVCVHKKPSILIKTTFLCPFKWWLRIESQQFTFEWSFTWSEIRFWYRTETISEKTKSTFLSEIWISFCYGSRCVESPKGMNLLERKTSEMQRQGERERERACALEEEKR